MASTDSVVAPGFETGVLEFAGKLRAFIRKRVSDAADAEDLAQDVLLKVFRARGALRDRRKLEAWIYQTARATVIDYYRRRRPKEELSTEIVDTLAPFDEVADRLRRSVRGFLATLPDHYRRPLVLAEFHGRTAPQIAEQLGLSLTATKSRLARGRALLRKKLLDCCQFETDVYGRVIDMRSRGTCDCHEEEPRLVGAAVPALEIAPAAPDDLPWILERLRQENLPTSDLEERPLVNFVVARSGTTLVGCAAAEAFGLIALVRSVVVAPEWRGRGVGVRLVREIESVARTHGLRDLYLLTTTAEKFFARLGYQRIERERAPAAICETAEFSALCPSTAVLMHRTLARTRAKRTPADGCRC